MTTMFRLRESGGVLARDKKKRKRPLQVEVVQNPNRPVVPFTDQRGYELQAFSKPTLNASRLALQRNVRLTAKDRALAEVAIRAANDAEQRLARQVAHAVVQPKGKTYAPDVSARNVDISYVNNQRQRIRDVIADKRMRRRVKNNLKQAVRDKVISDEQAAEALRPGTIENIINAARGVVFDEPGPLDKLVMDMFSSASEPQQSAASAARDDYTTPQGYSVARGARDAGAKPAYAAEGYDTAGAARDEGYDTPSAARDDRDTAAVSYGKKANVKGDGFRRGKAKKSRGKAKKAAPKKKKQKKIVRGGSFAGDATTLAVNTAMAHPTSVVAAIALFNALDQATKYAIGRDIMQGVGGMAWRYWEAIKKPRQVDWDMVREQIRASPKSFVRLVLSVTAGGVLAGTQHEVIRDSSNYKRALKKMALVTVPAVLAGAYAEPAAKAAYEHAANAAYEYATREPPPPPEPTDSESQYLGAKRTGTRKRRRMAVDSGMLRVRRAPGF